MFWISGARARARDWASIITGYLNPDSGCSLIICDTSFVYLYTLQGIRDWMLMVGVAFLVGIDLTIIVIYLAVEGSRGNLLAEETTNQENPRDTEGVNKTISGILYVPRARLRASHLSVLVCTLQGLVKTNFEVNPLPRN